MVSDSSTRYPAAFFKGYYGGDFFFSLFVLPDSITSSLATYGLAIEGFYDLNQLMVETKLEGDEFQTYSKNIGEDLPMEVEVVYRSFLKEIDNNSDIPSLSESMRKKYGL